MSLRQENTTIRWIANCPQILGGLYEAYCLIVLILGPSKNAPINRLPISTRAQLGALVSWTGLHQLSELSD